MKLVIMKRQSSCRNLVEGKLGVRWLLAMEEEEEEENEEEVGWGWGLCNQGKQGLAWSAPGVH